MEIHNGRSRGALFWVALVSIEAVDIEMQRRGVLFVSAMEE